MSESPIYLVLSPNKFLAPDVHAIAIDQDGEDIAHHISSSIDWARYDMGVTSERKHERYRERYPEGYRLVDLLELADPTTHSGFAEAMLARSVRQLQAEGR